MTLISIHASACKHVLRTVQTIDYELHSHPIDFNTPYCHDCMQRWHREEAPEPDQLRSVGVDEDMEDCARTLANMALAPDAAFANSPWGTPYYERAVEQVSGFNNGDEQRMMPFVSDNAIVYDSVEDSASAAVSRDMAPDNERAYSFSPMCTIEPPANDAPQTIPADAYLEVPGAPMWTIETSSLNPNSWSAECTTAQYAATYLGPQAFRSSTTSPNTITNTITSPNREFIRRRYIASRERRRMQGLLDGFDNFNLQTDPRQASAEENDKAEHMTWLRERLMFARAWEEPLEMVMEEFEWKWGFGVLDFEGGFKACWDAGYDGVGKGMLM